MNYFLVKIFVNGSPYTSSIGGQFVDGDGVHTFGVDGFSFNNLITQTFGSSDLITLDFQEGSVGESMDNAFNNLSSNYTLNNLGNISISSLSVACFSTCKATIGTSNSFEQWDMSGVESLAFCFPEAELSPRDHTWDLSGWDLSQCKDFDIMFMESKTKFTGLNEWDLSSAESFGNTFSGITDLQYQPDITELDTSNVSSFGGMFAVNTVFNQDISGWDVCKAEDMSFMFINASSFNQDLSAWKTPKIPSEPDLFATDSGMLGEIYYPLWGTSCFPTEVTGSLEVEIVDCSTYIGTVSISGSDDVCKDATSTYTANYTGSDTNVTYRWSTNDTLATIDSPTSHSTQVTFRTLGTQSLTCRFSSTTAPDSGVTDTKQVLVSSCDVDPCDGVTCGPNEYCDNGVCKPVDPCQGVTCGPDEVCVNGVCQPKPEPGPGADEFHYRYSNFYFTSRQDTAITTRDTSELNDYEQGIGRSSTVDRTLDKKIILPPDFNPNP